MSLTHPAIIQLRDHQTQLDRDGVMVGVSRQAIDETLDLTTELYEALQWIADQYANQDLSHKDFRVEAAHRAEAALSKATGGV